MAKVNSKVDCALVLNMFIVSLTALLHPLSSNGRAGRSDGCGQKLYSGWYHSMSILYSAAMKNRCYSDRQRKLPPDWDRHASHAHITIRSGT